MYTCAISRDLEWRSRSFPLQDSSTSGIAYSWVDFKWQSVAPGSLQQLATSSRHCQACHLIAYVLTTTEWQLAVIASYLITTANSGRAFLQYLASKWLTSVYTLAPLAYCALHLSAACSSTFVYRFYSGPSLHWIPQKIFSNFVQITAHNIKSIYDMQMTHLNIASMHSSIIRTGFSRERRATLASY